MKKTIKTLLAMMAGVMAFSACSKDALINGNAGTNPEAKPIFSFTAATESDGSTRAAIDGFDVKWQAGDAILLIDGTNNSKYNLTAGDGTTSGTFSKDEEATAVSGGNIYALYPYAVSTSHIPTQQEAEAAAGDYSDYVSYWKREYDEYLEMFMDYPEDIRDEYLEMEMERIMHDMSECGISPKNQAIILAYIKGETVGTPAPEVSGSSISNVILPNEQIVAAGQTVDPKAVLMVAKAESDNIPFKNVCSYVKVTPTVACKKIEVRAHNGENLTGTFTVAVSDGMSVSAVTDGSDVVTLTAADGDLAAGTYYIAVLPGTLAKGLDVKFFTSNDTFNYNTLSTSYTFVRNKVNNGGDNSGPTATYLRVTDFLDVYGTSTVYNNFTSVTINTGMTGPMPDGAKALNSDATLWIRIENNTKAFIETSTGKIMATSMRFDDFYNITTYSGLDKIDVSEANDLSRCFFDNRVLTSLDLSSWQINPKASTDYMFGNNSVGGSLSSLTLNNSFHSGHSMFNYTAQNSSNGCTVYGVTDEAVRTDLRTNTGWDSNKMRFDGE